MKTLKKKWLELTTLAIALIALFLSWQANMIGQSQITPKIVLIDAKQVEKLPSANFFYGNLCSLVTIGEEQRPRMVCFKGLYCVHQFRIANLGGASTSIVDFEATITYLDQEILLEGNGDSVASIKEEENDFSGSTISLIPNKASIYVENPDSPYPNIDLLQMPIRVDEYSAVDVFAVSTIFSNTNLEERMRTPYLEQGNILLDTSYSFLLSSGERIAVPAVPCLYVDKQP